MNENAELLLTQIFMHILNKSQEVSTVRRLAYYGFSQSTVKTKEEARRTAYSIANESEFDKLFTDKKKFFEIVGGVDKMADMLAEKEIITYQTAIDATSLVLTHTYVDAAAFDYCRVIEMVSPQSWEKYVIDRKLTLKDLKEKTYEDVLHQNVSRFVKSLEKESLIEKIDRIFEICQPPAGYVFIKGYAFDKSRLIKLDKLRHSFVHGEGLKQPIRDCKDELYFLQQTAIFLLGLLHEKFDIRLCPTLYHEYLINTAKQQSKTSADLNTL